MPLSSAAADPNTVLVWGVASTNNRILVPWHICAATVIAVLIYYTPDMQVLVQVRMKPEDFYAVASPTRDPFQEKCAPSTVLSTSPLFDVPIWPRVLDSHFGPY